MRAFRALHFVSALPICRSLKRVVRIGGSGTAFTIDVDGRQNQSTAPRSFGESFSCNDGYGMSLEAR